MSIRRTLPVLAALLLSAGTMLAQNEQPVDPTPPKGITVDEIIRKFVDKETQFAKARESYTYRQTAKVQTLDGDTVTGEYQNVTDIDFDPQSGRRLEHVVFAPQSTLENGGISMSKEDYDMIRSIMPFVMTNQTVNEYQIHYVGQQKVDELDTYVFDVAPKAIEKGKVYFQGRVWVDNKDLQIVMTKGRQVPEVHASKKNQQENLFPPFTTWREQVDGVYWFPTYSRADDTLHFQMQDVHIREIVKYTNYKRFGSNVKITYDGHEIDKNEKGAAQQQPGQQPQSGQSPPPAQRPPQ